MIFSTPLWLILLLAVPLVILLHALSIRWKRTPVSSLVFWNEVLKERKSSLRLRRLLTSLLLLLEVLAVVALAVALAGPQVLAPARMGAGDVILVLDATASMQVREGRRTRFDLARERGLALVAGLHGGSRMAVVLAARAPRLLSPFSADRTILRRVLQDAVPTDEPGNIASSVVFAMSLHEPRRGGQLVLETDGAFDELPGVDLSLPWLRIERVGAARDNVGITGLSFRRTAAGDFPVELFLSARNSGGAAVSVPLVIRAGGRTTITRTLDIGARQRVTVSLPWNGPLEGRVEAELRTGDAFPLDDKAYTVFAPARPLRVLLAGRPSWFIEKALTSLPGVTVRVPGNEGSRVLAGRGAPAAVDDAAFYVGMEPPPLEKGNFVLFSAIPSNLPLKAVGTVPVPPVTGWSRSNPLLDSVSLAGLAIGRALDLVPGPGFSILAASGTSPLILSWDHSGVKAVIVAFDPGASDFPLRPGFPIFLAHILSWFFPGWLEPQADQVQAGEARAVPVGSGGEVVVEKPDGRRVRLASAEPSVDFLDTDETGFYKVDTGEAVSEFAVTLADDAETDIVPRFTVPQAAAPQPAGSAGGTVPAWAVFAAAALALILLEWAAWVWTPAGTPGRAPERPPDRRPERPPERPPERARP
jgi:hypothetical protein